MTGQTDPYRDIKPGQYVGWKVGDAGPGGVTDDEMITEMLIQQIGSSVAAGNSPATIRASGEYLYMIVNNDDKLWTYSIANPDLPVKVSELAIGDAPSWIELRGKHAFVYHANDGTLKSIDISVPASPTVTSSVTLFTGGQRFAFNGRYAAVGGPESTADANKLSIVDCANPSSMSSVGTVVVGTVQRGIVPLTDGYFGVVSRDTNTFHTINATNPASPTAAGSLASLTSTLTPAQVDPQFRSGRPYVYLGGYGNGKFYVVDCVDLANPRKAGELTGTAGAEEIIIAGRYAFVVCRTAHVVDVIDIANPAVPRLVQSYTLPDATRTDRIAYINKRLYVPETATTGKLWTLRVSGGKQY